MRGLSSRAAENRRAKIEQDFSRSMSTLQSGATFGLLQDVYNEQGAQGSLEDYFAGQWGRLDLSPAGANERQEARAPVAPGQPGQEEEEASVGVGKAYDFY